MVALIGILVGIGGVSIKKQAESRAMIRVQNEIGDFFRVAAKRSLETGKRYGVHFDLVGKKIEIYRDEGTSGEWEDVVWKDNDWKTEERINGGARRTLEIFELPNVFEYEKIAGALGEQDIDRNITPNGNMSKTLTLYVFKTNSQSGIQDEQIAKYAIRLLTTDKHVKFLHVKEYAPKNEEIKNGEIKDGTMSASKTKYWKIIKSQ